MTESTVIDAQRLTRLVAIWRSDAQNLSLYRHCIDAALQSGAFEVVIEVAQQRLDFVSDEPLALFDLASGLIGQRNYAAALSQLARMPAAFSQSVAVLLNRGLCHYCLEQFDVARTPLEECYVQGDRGKGLLRLLVSTLHHLGEVPAALEIAGQAAQVAATDAALAGVMALLYLDADDAPKARQWARTALALNPRSVDGRVVEATLLTARLQKERARRMLEEVVADAPQTARAWLGLGTLSLIEQDLAVAKQQLLQCLELMPRFIGAWHVLAWAHMVSGELPAAEEAFERALMLDRNFAESHGGLAAVAALRGEVERSRRLIDTARHLDRECLSATYAQAVLKGAAGDPEQARRLVLDTVAEIAGRDSSALGQLLTHVSRGRKH
jgi:tetratricopeptide (TPR) repeat protein